MKFMILLRILVIGLLHLCSTSVVKSAEVEPPFPQLSKTLEGKQTLVHIVSESVNNISGYEELEEFADFELGKNVVIVTDRSGEKVNYIDTKSNLIYRYEPFSCIALTPSEMLASGYEGFWNAEFKLKLKDESNESTMHLFGVLAVWLNAGSQPKQYSSTSFVHSISKSTYKPAHRWTIATPDSSGIIYHLYFSKVSTKIGDYGADVFNLEMIQAEDNQTKKIVRTINIISIEYTIGNDVYEDKLQVPVGYGCVNSDVTEKAKTKFPPIDKVYFGPLNHNSFKIKLEATSTAFSDAGKTSDTISYELARSYGTLIRKLQLIRQRDSKQDVKTIFNYYFNVKYTIDLKSETCVISNIGLDSDKGGRIALTFNNNLKLDMNEEMMRAVFVDTKDFYFIKEVNRGSELLSYLYYERTTTDLFEGKSARIMRVYSVERSLISEEKLESVSIWVFDEEFKHIKEAYHLNIIETKQFRYPLDVLKLFDVSEDCYLNNELMKVNRDYAWIELTYPVPNQFRYLLASRSAQLKNTILERYLSHRSDVNVFLMPRMELVFQESGFILRLLLLDIPALPLLYDLEENTLIADQTRGAVQELAVDLDHCADLCRLNQCKAMSFCQSDHRCSLTTTLPDSDKNKLVRNTACKTYLQPIVPMIGSIGAASDILKLSLHQTISRFQHQNYDALTLPNMPDELIYPRAETKLDDQNYEQVKSNYIEQVFEYLNKSGHTLPMLTFTEQLGERLIILSPTKFELEQDPLEEFSVDRKESSTDQDDDSFQDKVPAFHEGLSLHRFKINAFDEQSLKQSRLFSGFNYDQCALACVDSKCSSFSYCNHRQECIITDIYSIGSSIKAASTILEEDPDCFIAQRDFLSKFNKFHNVYRPSLYKRSAEAINPSECAHSCVVETGFRCLAFDYCSPAAQTSEGRENVLGTCFYLENRILFTGSDDINKLAVDGKSAIDQKTNCDHYSRSYLADFTRIEYRQIDDAELHRLKTSSIVGKSVDQCADQCVNELTDCSAFQFCIDPDSKGAMQSCIMIESRPKGDAADYKIVVNGTGEGEIVKAGKYFVSNRNCHVFSLRRDTSEAHLRHLALTSEESENNESGSSGMSVGSGILLYLSMTIVFAAIGSGIIVAKNRSEFMRQKIERLQLFLRY